MNKIVVDKDKYLSLDNKKVILDVRLNELELNITGNVVVYEKLTIVGDYNLKIKVNENSSLEMYIINSLSCGNENIIIESLENSNLYLEEKIHLKDKLNYSIENNLKSSNINNEIKVHVVTENNGKINACIKSSVLKDTKNNFLNEEIKVLTLNNAKNVIKPDLLVSSNDIIANHSATISNIKLGDLYYLQSKGINEKEAKELFKNGFLYNKKINEVIN